MSKVEEYRQALRSQADWQVYLRKNSGLPGPRGNLELAQAFAEVSTPAQIESALQIPLAEAPENSPGVFVVFCAITALGKAAARGQEPDFARLRAFASDERWRIREAVAFALQYVGDVDMKRLLKEMKQWAKGNCYEQRAAAAALAEPRLLKDPIAANQVLIIFDRITETIERATDTRDEGFRVLRQGMAYCWSVAIAASPEAGKPLLEKWLASPSPDVQWVMRENLRKNRLAKMDAKWVSACQKKLAARS